MSPLPFKPSLLHIVPEHYTDVEISAIWLLENHKTELFHASETDRRAIREWAQKLFAGTNTIYDLPVESLSTITGADARILRALVMQQGTIERLTENVEHARWELAATPLPGPWYIYKYSDAENDRCAMVITSPDNLMSECLICGSTFAAQVPAPDEKNPQPPLALWDWELLHENHRMG